MRRSPLAAWPTMLVASTLVALCACTPAPRADAPEWFGFERSLGADCRSAFITDPPLADTACYGQLPAHVAEFIERLPDSHRFVGAAERAAARAPQVYKAVPGHGRRPDIVALIEHLSPFWIRSFEGADPETTVYMVYGPDCDAGHRDPDDPGRLICRSDGTYFRDVVLYRVHRDEPPEEVTAELAPRPPGMTPDETLRYGRYLAAEGAARSTDVKLDVSRLAYVPVLRWVFRPIDYGDYDPPAMPASDPRSYEDSDWRGRAAHFGFLVWNGERFELRDEVPAALWPCRTVRHDGHRCAAGHDVTVDRHLSTNDGSGTTR